MKDYYSRLNLPTNAAKREIEAELSTLAHAVTRRNARYVLLDPERRIVYDQCHRALRQIAFLRANLGLNRAPFWQLSDCEDFTTEPFSHRRHKRRPTLVKPLVTLLLAVVAAWGLARLFTPAPPSFVDYEAREGSPTEEPEEAVVIDPGREPSIGRSDLSWQEWHDRFRPEVAPVREAWRELTRGLDQHSFELAESRCRRLQRAVQACDRNRLQPSPDLELDSAIHRLLEHLAGAAQACRSHRYFEMTEELDRSQEAWDRIERKLRYQALEP